MPRTNFFQPFALLSPQAPGSMRAALRNALLLHLGVFAVMVLLPYFQTAPKVPELRVVQAVLVARNTHTPTPMPVALPVALPITTPVAEHTTKPIEKSVAEAATPPAAKPVAPAKIKPIEKPAPQIPTVAIKKTPAVKPLEKTAAKPAVKQAEKSVEKFVEKTIDKPAEKPAPSKSLLKKPNMNVSDFEKEMQDIRQQETQQTLQREAAKQEAAAQAAANTQIRDKYMRLINQQLASKWMRPLTARNGMQATLHITVLPGGEVGSVLVVKSSGNAAFDSSAMDAVRRASPLPVPNDATVFNTNFRAFNLKFNPEDL